MHDGININKKPHETGEGVWERRAYYALAWRQAHGTICREHGQGSGREDKKHKNIRFTTMQESEAT